MSSLKACCINQLQTQVLPILKNLDKKAYTQRLDILSGVSIGQHLRHTIEFFQCLIRTKNGVVNYDLRLRNPLIENDIDYSIEAVETICDALNNDLPIISVLETEVDGVFFKIKTSLERELNYMIEHIVHHLAIIKIALQTCFEEIHLPKNFGVAQSTIKYQNA